MTGEPKPAAPEDAVGPASIEPGPPAPAAGSSGRIGFILLLLAVGALLVANLVILAARRQSTPTPTPTPAQSASAAVQPGGPAAPGPEPPEDEMIGGDDLLYGVAALAREEGDLALTDTQRKTLSGLLRRVPGHEEGNEAGRQVLSHFTREQLEATFSDLDQVEKDLEAVLPDNAQSNVDQDTHVRKLGRNYLKERSRGASASRPVTPADSLVPPSDRFPPTPYELCLAILWLRNQGGSLELTPQQAAGVLHAYKPLVDYWEQQGSSDQDIGSVLTAAQRDKIEELRSGFERGDDALEEARKALEP